ncbi:MAG: homocitrate synthase [Clostridiaceae bacterium]|nr:homocitrate synthase [Clostridiaceae bacterium]
MNIFIVDTTLRDGEQKAGIALGINQKVDIARILDSVGVYQIEAGIPVMGDDEKQSIKKMAALGMKSRISAWNRLNLGDIKESIECGADIVHISVPSSDIQIRSKLNKDRDWILDNLKRCIAYAQNRNQEITIGLEDASRADFKFLMNIITIAFKEGVKRVRYADTVGILSRRRIYDEIRNIREDIEIDIEIHTHNDMGMAVSNSLAAAEGGAEFVDCTIGGIGERAGNCNLLQFVKAAKACFGVFEDVDELSLVEAQKDILRIIKGGRVRIY